MAPQDAYPCGCIAPWPMSRRFYSLFFSMANSSRSFSFMAHESSAIVHPRRPSEFCFLPPHGSTAIKGVWRCKTVGDRVRSAITARSRW